MKRIISMLLLVTVLVAGFGITANAATVTPVEPMWDNTASISLFFDFVERPEGYAYANVVGKTGTTSITIYILIYKQNGSSWSFVKGSINADNAQTYYLSCPFEGEQGGYYKAEFEIRVYHGADNCETIKDTMYLRY